MPSKSLTNIVILFATPQLQNYCLDQRFSTWGYTNPRVYAIISNKYSNYIMGLHEKDKELLAALVSE